MRFSALIWLASTLGALASSNVRECTFSEPRFYVHQDSDVVDTELFSNTPFDESQLSYSLAIPFAAMRDPQATLIMNFKNRFETHAMISTVIESVGSTSSGSVALGGRSFGSLIQNIELPLTDLDGDRVMISITDPSCGQVFSFDLYSQGS